MTRPLRVANCSGFYGDRLAAAREQLEGGPIDVLTGDYLAELTLFLLARARQKDPAAGFASTFLRQAEDVLGLALERGARIVVNAGGLDPAGLAARLRELSVRLGLRARVAHVEGDDLLPHLDSLLAEHPLRHLDSGEPLAPRRSQVLSANAYLGGWGIAAALDAGADVVVCGRVADAALVLGPAAWHFGWRRDDWNALAGALVAGHVLECGAHATGGNYAFFQEVPDLRHPGFPIAEIEADGSCVITKHPGSGGLVSIGTVTAQLLYEIEGPRYPSPDVVARFDTLRLSEDGPDRVRIEGARGEPAPATAKLGLTLPGGHRNEITLVVTGLDVEGKVRCVQEALAPVLARCASADLQLLPTARPETGSNQEACSLLRIVVRDPDPRRVGRAFSSAVVELALSSYPGFFATAPPADASPYGIFWPALLPAGLIEQVVVLEDGTRLPIEPAPGGSAVDPLPAPAALPSLDGPTRHVPLGTLIGARSGDKGGNANVGFWASSGAAHAWLRGYLTVERFRQLLPEAAALPIDRYELPNLRALNFVVHGLLGDGVSASTRFDPQAKGLGEYLRSRLVEVPESLL